MSAPRQKGAHAAFALTERLAGRMSTEEAARRIFWNWAVYGLAAEVLTDIWASIWKDDDDEERWDIRDYIASAIAGPVAALPLLGSGLGMLLGRAVGTGGFGSSANPIDVASETAAQMFVADKDGDRGPATWKALAGEEDAPVTKIRAAVQSDTGALSLIAGPFPRSSL